MREPLTVDTGRTRALAVGRSLGVRRDAALYTVVDDRPMVYPAPGGK